MNQAFTKINRYYKADGFLCVCELGPQASSVYYLSGNRRLETGKTSTI